MDFLRECLLWLDAVPLRYWTAAWLAFGVTFCLAGLPARSDRGGSGPVTLLFGLSVVFTLATFRWPTWFYTLALNPDEAQIVAGAITLNRFPVYWEQVDGMTHGPFCEYALVAASWLGAPFNYVTARIMAVLFQAGSLLALWGTFRLFMPETLARMAILPGLAFWSFGSWDDFQHFSSELPGVFFMALACFGIALVLKADALRRAHYLAIYLSGVCLGAVPFCKLQSVPQAAVTALLGAVLIWRVLPNPPARLRLIGLFTAGGMTVSVVVGIFVMVHGLWDQVWNAYFLSALSYVDSSHPFASMPGRFFNFSATSPAFAWFFWGGLGFSLLHFRGPWTVKSLRAGAWISWLLLAVAYLSVLRPGRETVHYLHLLVVPITMLAGFTLAGAVKTLAENSDFANPASLLRNMVFFSFLLLTLAPQVYDRVVSWNRFAGFAREHWESPLSRAARFVLKRARPGDTMAMWGWNPHLLVEVQMPHGTREAHSANQLMQWSMTGFFLDRYLLDLKQRNPTWFVDSVGPGAFVFKNRATSAHETIPELRAWISAHYELVAELRGKRIYRLRTPGPR